MIGNIGSLVEDKILKIKWYRNKTDVFIARAIWLFAGISAIYFGLNKDIYKTEYLQILYLILGVACIFTSFIAGRWSYKEKKT